MKTKLYSTLLKAGLSFITLILFLGAFAGTWRVNNTDNSADFVSIQAAINNMTDVADGDTLFVEGSAFVYSGFTLNRLLYIIGPGYRLSENPQTGTLASVAVIDGTAEFVSGSEGSVFSGFVFDDDNSTDDITYVNGVNNITIMRCYQTFAININSSVQNIIIVQNYFEDDAIRIDNLSEDFFQGVIFDNNIVRNDFNRSTDASAPRTFASVDNNIFLEDVVVTTATFRNNIWDPLGGSASINITSGIIENNLFFNSQLGTENGNMGFTDNTTVFGDRTGRSFDEQWALDDGSTFKNSGTDGTDPGPFGGSNPYVLSGVPPLPVIYEINTSGFGNQENGLPVEIKVRSSN
ncbi:MAG: hypothetical protein R8G66_08550 [Cytophagales bacterium]|nr:hypothetical protein [Cytophagales bacterium]